MKEIYNNTRVCIFSDNFSTFGCR